MWECVDEIGEKARSKVNKVLRFILQVSVIVAIYCVGSFISSILPISLPGSILGMLVFLILLFAGILKVRHVDHACEFLIDNMSIFFIPAAVAIMGCFSLLTGNAFGFIFVCVATTLLTFFASSYTAMFVMRLVERRQRVVAACADGADAGELHDLGAAISAAGTHRQGESE